MEDRLGGPVGIDAQLVLQHRRTVVVRADRAGPVADVGLQLHQGAISDLLQRLQLNPPPGRGFRSLQVSRAQARSAHQVTQGGALTCQPLTLGEHPVVTAPRQQVTAVHAEGGSPVPQGALVATLAHRAVCRVAFGGEHVHINSTARTLVPAQRRGLHDQPDAVPERPPQLVQLAPEVGQRLCIAGLGPEQTCDPLP